MIRLPFHFSRLAWLVILSILANVHAALAQAQPRVLIHPPITDQFPTIRLFLSITDTDGSHMPGLRPQDLRVLEDGESLPVSELQEITLGTRQIFVINTGRGMRGRDAAGLTRFDYLRRALLDWWAQAPAATYGADDLSLLTREGDWVTHQPMAAQLASALSQLEPAYSEDPLGSDLLMHALDYAGGPPPIPGMSTHLIFFTPILRGEDDLPLATVISRARASGTIIHPILVGPQEVLELPEVENLQRLAQETGGSFLFFQPGDELEPLARRVLSQRNLYQLTYHSRANRSGDHTLQIQLSRQGTETLSNRRTFRLEISPPQVIFLQPRERIIRQSDDPALSLEALHPTSITFHVLIAFPDGYPRTLSRSQLLVDGQVVAVNSQQPFDQFTWDLSHVLVTKTYRLQVQVRDSLGLEGSSVVIPLTVEVIPPPSGLSALEPAFGTLAAVAAGIIFFSAILTLVITQSRRRAAGPPRPAGPPARRAQLGLARAGEKVEAVLEPLQPDAQPITLTGQDMEMGRDPSLAAYPLNDPSVDGLHARIVRHADGTYVLRDLGSRSGTWVNYRPVAAHGQPLQEGDVIHFGRQAFRFRSTSPAPRPDPIVEPFQGDPWAFPDPPPGEALSKIVETRLPSQKRDV
jgi:hypothetical protein